MNLPELAELARWLGVLLALALVVIVAVYAVNVLLAVGTVLVIILVGGLLVYALGGRIWDWVRHGKPLVRGDWGSSDDGGPADGD